MIVFKFKKEIISKQENGNNTANLSDGHGIAKSIFYTLSNDSLLDRA